MHRSPGVFFDHDKGKSHSSGKLLFAARVIPYRGSWLDIEFDSKDVVHARIDRRRKIPVTSLLMALGMDGEEILSTFYNKITYKRAGDHWRIPFTVDRFRGLKAVDDLVDADTGEVVVEAGKKITARQAKQLADKGLKAIKATDEDLLGSYLAEDIVNYRDRRDLSRGRRRDRREDAEGAARRPATDEINDPRHRPRQYRRLHPQHARRRQEREPPGRAVRHLPRHASGRAADARNRRGDVQLAVLRRRALRPFGRRPRQDEHAPRAQGRGHRARAAQGRHHRGRQDAGRTARRQGRDRRHRQSRQPPRAFGRRADGEPVPRRPAAHGARDQGAHVVDRDRHGHAAGPDQRQAGGRRRARVLRLLAAVAVHGPDQPAVGDHPQASSVGAWTWRSDPRARRLRGARRAPDALRPHLPDRDAGRPEYRPDQLARDLRPRQQVRLHREPVPQDRRRQGDDDVVYLSAMEEAKHYVAQANAELDKKGALHRRVRDLPACRRSDDGAARKRRPDGRVAEADGFGRRGADPVPRERRRQPRADGLEHAASGRAAGARRSAVRRHRHGADRCP